MGNSYSSYVNKKGEYLQAAVWLHAEKKDLYRCEAKKYVSVEHDKYEDSDVKVFTVTERVGQD